MKNINIDYKTNIIHIEMKKNIWTNDVFNHYINNWIQHIYFSDNLSYKIKVFELLNNIFKALKQDKTKLKRFLDNEYKNNILDPLIVFEKYKKRTKYFSSFF